MNSLLRMVLVTTGFFVAAAFSATSARAATEYCGAGVQQSAVSPKTLSDASDVYALSFTGKSARTVSGTVMMHADNGWYAADFQNVKIEARSDHYRAPNLMFTRTDFNSDYVYVRFPTAVKLLSSYVARAAVSQDAVSQWDGAMHECYAYDNSQFKNAANSPHPNDVVLLNKPPSPVLEPGAAALEAKAVPAPGTTDCANPFVQATVPKPVPPQWPFGYRTSVSLMELVRVTVGPQGEVDDAVVYVPTGVKAFDDAGLAAARASTYKAARAFCKDVPGDYLFRAMFNPY